MKRIAGVDPDLEPECAELTRRRGGERAVGVAVAVDPDHVVRFAIERERDLFHARQVDRAEALEDRAGPALRVAVGSLDRDERREDLVVLPTEPFRAGDPHALGKQANTRRQDPTG